MSDIWPNIQTDQWGQYFRPVLNDFKCQNRLICKTALENEGWEIFLPISKLFEKYNLNPDQIELDSTKVYHPRIPGNHVTFSPSK